LDKIKDRDSLISVDTPENLYTGLLKAADVIRAGGMVAYPTESFYGLGVSAADEEAIRRLFAVKKRRSDNPVLILIPSIEVLDQCVASIPELAHILIRQFWPGGLTLVFEAGPNLSPLLTACTGKIGIRLSSHPVATALVKAVGVPITGTSANISGQPACVNAGEVLHSLGKGVDLILDGGATRGAPGSTILDITISPPKILRQGVVGRERLRAFIPILS
jgi:L-threonylcarbamoyladenylate synthase